MYVLMYPTTSFYILLHPTTSWFSQCQTHLEPCVLSHNKAILHRLYGVAAVGVTGYIFIDTLHTIRWYAHVNMWVS
jgi:hypothetical protein